MILSSRLREARSERWCGQHRFTSLRKWPIGLGLDALYSSHCGTLTLTPVLSPPLSSLGKYLAFSQAPGPQCSFLCNHPLRPVYLTWLQRVACTLSHNPSSLEKWVSFLILDVPKHWPASHISFSLSMIVPFKSWPWRPALLGHLSP